MRIKVLDLSDKEEKRNKVKIMTERGIVEGELIEANEKYIIVKLKSGENVVIPLAKISDKLKHRKKLLMA